MTLGIDHIAIAARDPRGLADWYAETLEFAIIADNGQSPPTLLIGGADGMMIEVMPSNGQPPVKHEWADPGLRHVALRVTNLAEARDRLMAAGIGSIRPGGPAMGGGELWNFEDPEGNVLQIVERPAEFGAL